MALRTEIYFSRSADWRSKSMVMARIGFILRPLSLACSCHMVVCSYDLFCVHAGRESKLSGVSSHMNTSPILRAPSSWSHLNLIINTSQRSQLQIASHWEVELQYMNLAGEKHNSFHSNYIRSDKSIIRVWYIKSNHSQSIVSWNCPTTSWKTLFSIF